MPIDKRFEVSPELLGQWVYEGSAGNQARQNVESTREFNLKQAELGQRGAIAGAQLRQHADDRASSVAMRGQEIQARYAGDQADSAARVEAEKIRAQNLGDAQENQYREIEMRANLEAAAKSDAGIVVPDFTQGPLQNHEMAVANQRLAGYMGQSYERELLAKVATGDPAAIKQAMSAGLMRFTQQQQMEAGELQKALGQLRSATEMHPTDRARGEAMIKARLAAIQPQLVPEDQRAPDINTEVNKRIGVWTHPVSGKQYPITLDRNGEPRVLDTNDPKEVVPKPTTFRERLNVDPAFHSAQLREAYGRVLERKKAAHEQAANDAILSGEPAPAFEYPTPQEQHAELEEMVGIADFQNQQFGGGTGGMPRQQQQQQMQPPPADGAAAPPQPPPGVAEGVAKFAQSAGLPITGSAAAGLPKPRLGGKPAAAAQPREGLDDATIQTMAAKVIQLRQRAKSQGGLDPNDFSYYIALCKDLGIAP